MKTADFDYDLPPDLIAQHPLEDRIAARMLGVDRRTGALEHRHVSDLPDCLCPGDLLVVNDTRVIPARLLGVKEGTGGRVELLLLEELAPGRWEALCGASRRPPPGTCLIMGEGRIRATVVAWGEQGRVIVDLAADRAVTEVLDEVGLTPVPPYIRRDYGRREAPNADRDDYQTVFARAPGAVAAPTAGLHLTAPLLARLAERGIPHCMVTLHVGLGTFKPVDAEEVEAHHMESERFTVPGSTADAIAAARARGGRVVAVGSTVVRTLETVAARHGTVCAASGRTDLFIRPPYAFKVVDAMLTNFHLPRSTLLMMVSALAGTELIRRAYREAVAARYRFYSYGDCMLIE